MSRRRFIYRPHPETGELEAIEVSQDWDDAPRRTGDGLKFELDNLRATDGTDISSKTKHDRYMKERGVCLASDYTHEWAAAAKEREAYRKGERVRPTMREAVGRADYQLQTAARRKRR